MVKFFYKKNAGGFWESCERDRGGPFGRLLFCFDFGFFVLGKIVFASSGVRGKDGRATYLSISYHKIEMY